jgi:CO/xanthine dehydrogenase Mo-binding subunit
LSSRSAAVTDVELALDADGRFLALRVHTLANVGAYVSSDRNLLATFSNIATLRRRVRVRGGALQADVGAGCAQICGHQSRKNCLR